ncbi:MAG TPA: hypothetical protein VJI46_07825 [Candidatus Nanoarchaeia archaeon]|nr:hypothetical protein [Candidatus Nanoarchaeia archaeon]
MRKIIAILAVLMLILVGCKTEGPEFTSEDVYKGIEGISLSFTKNSPTPEVFENSVFPVGIEVWNKGAYDIEEGYLFVNLDTDYMEAANWIEGVSIFPADAAKAEFELKGKSDIARQGDRDVAALNVNTKFIDVLSEKHTSTVSATACYRYQTLASPNVCIDTDPFGIKEGQKSCTASDITLTGGQGAPIAVEKVEVKMLPSQTGDKIVPQFRIYVKNMGNGQVVDAEKVADSCSSQGLSRTDINAVSVTAALSSGIQLDCIPKRETGGPEGFLRLKGGEDYVLCHYQDGIPLEYGTFKTTLNIVLDYGYVHSISKDVTIKKVVIV